MRLRSFDTTSDTTQSATRRNRGQPQAKKTAYLSWFCNVGQHPEKGVRRIVALKVAGSIPVGHPLQPRIGKPDTREWSMLRCLSWGPLTPLWHHREHHTVQLMAKRRRENRSGRGIRKPVQTSASSYLSLVMRLGQRFESLAGSTGFATGKLNTLNMRKAPGSSPWAV